MDLQSIDVGKTPNDGTGTPLRTAWQMANANFEALKAAIAALAVSVSNVKPGKDGAPGVVQSVNGTSAANITLAAGDVGALAQAKDGSVSPASVVITGSGSTGDVSGMSVKAGAVAQTLATWFSLLAPLASPKFSGSVSAPVVNLSDLPLVPTNDYNDAGRTNTQIFGAVGTAAAPTTDKSAVGIWQKVSNYLKAGVNATIYVSHVKMGAGGANEASAVFGEGIDNVGGAQSSIIGGRFHAQLNGGVLGSPIGASAYATLAPGVTSFQNAVGFEAAIENLLVDAPKVYVQATMTAALLLGNTGTKRSDAALITNPYTALPFRNALLVPAGSVSDAIVRTFATTEYGIDLSPGSQTIAAMKVPSSLEKQAPTLDNSGTAGRLIAAGASALLGAGSGGLWVVTNMTTQTTGVYAGDAATGIALLGGSPAWVAPTKTPGVGQMSVALDSDGLRVFNGPSPSGGNADALFSSVTIKTR